MFPRLTVKFKEQNKGGARDSDNVHVSVKQSDVNADPVKIKIAATS
jgi:hypothetical protein